MGIWRLAGASLSRTDKTDAGDETPNCKAASR